MQYVFAISLMLLVLWYMFARELPTAMGVIVPTSVIRRRYFILGVVAIFALAMLLPMSSALGVDVAARYSGIEHGDLLLVAISAFATVLVLERLGMTSSLYIALLGALETYRVFAYAGAEFDYSFMLGWVVAPMVAMLLSATIYYLYRQLIGRRPIHIIRLSGYLRYFVIAGFVLMAIALGINSGSLLLMNSSLMPLSQVMTYVVPIALFLLMALGLNAMVRRKMDSHAEDYSELSTQAVVSICYAVTITLVLFSTSAVEAVGMSPLPIAPSTLVMGALVGVCVVERRWVVDSSSLGRSALGVVLTPMLTILCFYMLSSLFVSDVAMKEDASLLLFVLSLVGVMLALFARYVRKQERLHEASRKLIRNQQQELFENQKAINAMELNAILAENHSLHGTLELKRKEIINVALGISEQKEFLEMLAEKVHSAAKASSEEKDRIIAEIEKELGQRTSFSGEIDEFYTQAEVLHKDFSVKLTEEFPNLTVSERRLATLLRLGFSSKYIATLMNISPKSVEISRYRLRQKLGLNKGDNLINFIKSI